MILGVLKVMISQLMKNDLEIIINAIEHSFSCPIANQPFLHLELILDPKLGLFQTIHFRKVTTSTAQ